MQFRKIKKSLKLGAVAVALSALAGCDYLAGVGQYFADKYADQLPPMRVYIPAYSIMSVGGHRAAVLGFDDCPVMRDNPDKALWLSLPGSQPTANLTRCTHIPAADGDVTVQLLWVRQPGQDFQPEASQTQETWHVIYQGRGIVLQRPNGELVTPSTEHS